MRCLFFILGIFLVFSSCLSAFYVRNETGVSIIVTTKNNQKYTLRDAEEQEMQESDYPMYIAYAKQGLTRLAINNAGCYTISGAFFGDIFYPMHEVNWCPEHK